MLKGDLTSTPLAPLLLELADDSATGCLVITDSTEDEALVYFKNGLVYSVSVPGSRPQLGAKLVSSGALAPEALSEALEAQRTELQGWRLGELLVHLGYVDQPVVEAFVAEQVSEALWDLLRWSDGRWKFRKNVKAREDVGPPMTIVDLLETLRERGYVWETISAVVHGPGAVPRLSTRGDTSSETTLDNDAWSMLCKIDGERSVAELAADCGYTLFEAGHVIVSLVQAGLVDIDEEIDIEGSALYGATTLSSALAGELDEATFTPAEPDDEDALTRLARLVNEVAGTGEATDDRVAAAAAAEPTPAAATERRDRELDNAMTVAVNRHSGESFAASIARVSGALSEVLGEVPPPDIDPVELAARRRRSASSTDDPEWQRRRRLRTAAAAELASAQALIETLRPDRDSAATTPEFTGDVPKVLSRAMERERAAARDAEETARHAAEDAAREAAEQFARAAAEEADRLAAEQEAARIAAEQAAAEEADRLAAEQEAARIAAEQAAAEAAARLEAEAAAENAAEAARLAAEQAAAAEAARLEAEAEAVAAEAARVQAERDVAEEAAWAEYWQREEAERAAAAEAARVAAELEAERLAAEEAERAAAEEAARQAEAQAEADRIAAEEAARQAEAQAEADRIAAEEAERQAELEAERAAAEEAARQAAAQAEADRIAAEEAARQAEAQAEADRIAAEEAERRAQLEAERAAAEEEAEAAARRNADKDADAAAAKRNDEAAAASALLAEFAASSAAEETDTAADAGPEPDYDPASDELAEAEVHEPVAVGGGWSDPNTTDTAALLRELSSLGGDDDRDVPSGPTTPSRPRTNAPEKKVKKKIGLFGL